jgi:hypothetical protein
VKRSGRNEPMWFVIHKCMEAMLGIASQTNKIAIFLNYLYILSSSKWENKRAVAQIMYNR